VRDQALPRLEVRADHLPFAGLLPRLRKHSCRVHVLTLNCTCSGKAIVMKTSLLSLSAAAFVAVAAGALASSPALAEIEYPWCAITSLSRGTPMCDFATIDQCRATIGGGAGFCQPNPRAAQAQMPPAQRRGVR
jgi:hypothetical protein